VDAVILTIGGEFSVVEKEVKDQEKMVWMLGVLALATLIIGAIGAGTENTLLGGVLGAIAYPIIYSIFFGAEFIAIIAMLVIGFLVCIIASLAISSMGEGGGYSYGSSSGGGSFGDSFSGGGGSFGGGGATGGW